MYVKMLISNTFPFLSLSVRQVKCLVSVWMHHVPQHTAVIQLSAKESVVLHAMVSTYCMSICSENICFLMSLSNLFCLLHVILHWSSFHCYCSSSSSLCVIQQNVSMTDECMLMEKCSPLLGADPACSAGVRQVHVSTFVSKKMSHFAFSF